MTSLPPLPSSFTDPTLLSTLQTFLKTHAQTTCFTPAITVAEKTAYVDRIVQGLRDESGTWSQDVFTHVLSVLRILLRESVGCDALYSVEGTKLLVLHAGLGSNAYQPTPHTTEGLKCLCNVLLHYPAARGVVWELGGVEKCVEIIKDGGLASEPTFLIFRILFLATVERQVVQTVLKNGIVGILTERLERLVKAPVEGMELMVLNEILKLVFNISDEETDCTGLVPPILDLLRSYPLPTPPLSPPISHAIHTLLHFPTHHDIWFPNDDYTLLRKFVDILEETVGVHGEDAEEEVRVGGVLLDESCSPLVLVLVGVARGDVHARAVMRDWIMPNDIDRSQPLDKGTTLTARLIRYMTSITYPNLRQAVSELFFILSNESPETLVSYIGYGPAAGFLYNRGLLPSGGPAPTEDIDPITGEFSAQKADEEWKAMSEEEREREAEKLFVLLDRLNRTGVIKAVPRLG
ncbi:uncharacterized protein SPPG_07521 [Spizellomyces punctatus DAOM BR117]|uniref:Guanine nucleotide exchange factor n=1 Tax=Spizellomyces punctatus (strain DAOM BR117) TaxID=645134 RepID=A0A0L0H901_SPIPD|nr:uncharacterized protein SPPG_07521 [Spizellomyces punctatus DAOM BR117]KNC97128.1 hypothetical protein SPPG_07521 [Spizellomyces punctatus DAOM BR117]|eukprot:XP_016605168.1 hypothetical protein SPPG_07521 [Spizellomyces punctatus DAOM BR117]